MSSLVVRGGRKLTGRIEPSANKNAVLPVLCATLLCDAPVTLRNVPEITDVVRIADFFGDGDRKVGSLLSQTIAPVPEPRTYALFLGGLGVMGWMARRRRKQGTQ